MITKATPTVKIFNGQTDVTSGTATFTYSGSPQGLTATVTGVGNDQLAISSITYDGSATAPTNVKLVANVVSGYAVVATFNATQNYNPASASATEVITKATPVFSNLVGPTITFGATPTALSGKVSKGTLIPTGYVAIALNGVTQQAPIQGDGTFSSSFATGALTVVPGSPYTITYNYPGDSNFYGVAPDTSKALTVATKSTSTILAVTPSSVQYSDQVTLSATVSPATLGGQTLTGSVALAINGASVGSAPISASGVATLPPTTITLAPGSYSVNATFTSSNPNFKSSSDSKTLPVTPEDARVTYAGNMFVGIPLTATSAPITLIATIQDITATGDAGDDSYPGDIRNATVTFVNRDASNATLCTAPVLLVNSSDTKTASGTCTFTGTVDNTGSKQYTVGIVVSGYYARNASTDNTVVTISQVGAGMITGGGYLAMQNSAGTIAGDQNTKNNFGFNVKYNKNGNLQGNINTIVRRKESDGIQHVYQIKGNSMTALAVSQLVNGTWVSGCTGATSTSPCKAQFNGKASIQDITNLLVPLSVPGSGNSSLQFNMTDYGSPGSSDTIGITLWNGTGGIWFSNNWVGTPPATVEQVQSVMPRSE